MSDYIEIPIETDPELLAQDAFDFLEAAIVDWVPNDGNLDTIMIEAQAQMVAEARDVASAVPTDIFRYYGGLVGIEPTEGVAAQGTTDWTVIDDLGYTIPAGTQVGIEVTGDESVPFETTVDAIIPPGFTSTAGVPIQAIESGSDASGITGPVTLLDTLDFVTNVTLVAPTSGGVDEETDDDYLNRLRLRLQLLAPRPILPRDFAIMAQDIAGVERAVALDGYNPNHNLLTANQSNIETDTTGWTADTNTTIARDTAQAWQGSASLRLRSTAAGDVNAFTSLVTGFVAGNRVSASAYFRTSVTRTCRILIDWYTSADVLISSSSADLSVVAGTFIRHSVVGNAPATAAKARIYVKVIGTAAGSEDHWIDGIALQFGSGLDWIVGGTTVLTGQERMVTIAVVDADGEPVSTVVRDEVDDYLEEHREVNFLVYIIDPDYTNIDVTFTAKAAPGFDLATIETAAEQAVTDYLSPANWGLPGESEDVTVNPDWINQTTVRYLELAQVINEVGGIDYITALTFRKGTDSFATTDITLTGAIPLPRAGVITGTVT